MLFLLPATASAVLTVGKAIGIAATVFGIGAGIKRVIDFKKAKKRIAKEAKDYEEMAARINETQAQTDSEEEFDEILRDR
jgi:predicted ThiF/HesA family dinucleotide-utilizing enzyme